MAIARQNDANCVRFRTCKMNGCCDRLTRRRRCFAGLKITSLLTFTSLALLLSLAEANFFGFEHSGAAIHKRSFPNGGVFERSQSPYLITEEIVVEKGEELTIEPGVTLQFDPGVGITVRGVLNAKVSLRVFATSLSH